MTTYLENLTSEYLKDISLFTFYSDELTDRNTATLIRNIDTIFQKGTRKNNCFMYNAFLPTREGTDTLRIKTTHDRVDRFLLCSSYNGEALLHISLHNFLISEESTDAIVKLISFILITCPNFVFIIDKAFKVPTRKKSVPRPERRKAIDNIKAFADDVQNKLVATFDDFDKRFFQIVREDMRNGYYKLDCRVIRHELKQVEHTCNGWASNSGTHIRFILREIPPYERKPHPLEMELL